MTKKISPKKFWEKVVQSVEKLASKNMGFSQNRRFKFLPVNFRYHRTSVGKSKNFGHLFIPWLLGAEIRLWLSRSVLKWQGKNWWGKLKKKLPKSKNLMDYLFFSIKAYYYTCFYHLKSNIVMKYNCGQFFIALIHFYNN